MDPGSPLQGNCSLTGCWSSTITIQPADGIAYDESDWAGALVVIVSGRLHLECWSGERACFEEGDVLFLTRLNLRRITNPGLTPLVLRSIRRK